MPKGDESALGAHGSWIKTPMFGPVEVTNFTGPMDKNGNTPHTKTRGATREEAIDKALAKDPNSTKGPRKR